MSNIALGAGDISTIGSFTSSRYNRKLISRIKLNITKIRINLGG